MNKEVSRKIQRAMFRLKKDGPPIILTCMGVIGVAVTVVTAVKATPKAIKVLEDAKEEKGDELTTTELINAVAPLYIPSLVAGAATVSCIIGACVTNRKKQASMASACYLTSNAFKEYTDKVKEIYGEEADNKIREAIAMDKRNEDVTAYVPGLNSFVQTGDKHLFYDEYRGKYFEASMDEVRNAEYHLNRNFALRGCASLNEFYEFLGLDPIESGDVLGWGCGRLMEEYESPWIDFDHRHVTMEDGLECYIITMVIPPVVEFEEW